MNEILMGHCFDLMIRKMATMINSSKAAMMVCSLESTMELDLDNKMVRQQLTEKGMAEQMESTTSLLLANLMESNLE